MTSDDSTSPLPALLDSRKDYQLRLELILSQSITGVTSTANPAAAATLFVALYVGAVDASRPIRPSTITWMSDSVAERRLDTDRREYYKAALGGDKAVSDLCSRWGITRGAMWYANNSREPVRDESIRELMDCGAMRILPGMTTNSPKPRYYLAPAFAALFDPSLDGDQLAQAINEWQSANLQPIARYRAATQRDSTRSDESVTVDLPGGGQRILDPGDSSKILKGVIEKFTANLALPRVLFISQSAEKVDLIDGRRLRQIGLEMNAARLLPDCLIVDLDVDNEALWFVEAVASDGAITEARKRALLEWVGGSRISPDRFRFLTAFMSRTASPAKRNLPRLAKGTHAWFANEPESWLTWDEIRNTGN